MAGSEYKMEIKAAGAKRWVYGLAGMFSVLVDCGMFVLKQL